MITSSLELAGERGDLKAAQCRILSMVEYPEWLANVVPVPKRTASTTGHSMLSFMDGFLDNQILMAPRTWRRRPSLPSGIRSPSSFGEVLEGSDSSIEIESQEVHFQSDFWETLGYMVSERGIEVDPDKIRAILDMPAPRTERERAFERIGEYLLSPPVLAPPTPGCPLLLYLSISDVALGCMLAQLNDSGKDWAIYYLSKRMLDYETRYVMIERYCLALVWATRRLRHYMIEYLVHLISRLDLLRYLFDRPSLVGRLMRWLLLTEFDIHYVTQKSVRESIVADHLASLPVSDGRAIDDDFPDEDVAAVTSLSGWRMYFDGAANHSGYGIDVLLISPHGDHIPRSVRLAFSNRHPTTNNIVEYEACILGLETALELGIK
ncbi:Retrovirus-related Pol polyprotein from transposon 297 [Vitis vinifera]|uniref:Retrovirus-related Pol polyprotein from transposon 297 n=1 Tax=Vitis vinifera TaxID=29760 RepID=A0A438D332_VITVI|nr:Retrovirus-related Pol polyprotein from transposon 297 [Vitis vinifera]